MMVGGKILKYSPFGVIIDQTTLCDQRCSFCHRSYKDKNVDLTGAPSVLDFEIYKEIIDQSVECESLRWLSLCGPMGDPLMVSDLADRLEYAKNKNYFTTILINCNGQALDQHDMERLLRNSTSLQFSVDSIRNETYEKIHCGGDLQKVLANIEKLYNLKQQLTGELASINIRFTENENNFGEWREYQEYFKGRADNSFRVKVHSFMGRLPDYSLNMGATLCNNPWEVVNFNYRGEMTNCCINWKLEPTFGSIVGNSLKELWESGEFEEWRAKRLSGTCSDCGGLGSFQQRVDCKPTQEEIDAYKEILSIGEIAYYEKKWLASKYQNQSFPLKILRKVFRQK